MDKAKKTAYFNNIIADNEKNIRRVIFFYCADKQEIWDDLYQEILINIWESLDSFRGDALISTWIYRIAINISILHSKKSNNRKHILCFSSIDGIEEYISSQEDDIIIENLYALVEHLNTIDKTIMLLYLDKRSHKEIAEIMGLSITNIGTKISRIVKKLKEINVKIEYDNY